MGRGQGPQLRSRLGSFHTHGRHLEELLQHHPLNNVVDLIVPYTTVDETTALQPQGVPFCHVAALSLPQLLDPAFADLHLRQADGRRTFAVSVRTSMDTSDAVAVTPDGLLHLSLRADTHEQLGIQGTTCEAPRNGDKATERRYGCVVNLVSKRFRRGVRFYDRIQQHVRDYAAGEVTMLVSTVDAHGCSCDVELPPSARGERVVAQPQTWTVTRVSLPPLEAVFGGDDASAVAATSPQMVRFVADWLGAIVTGAIGHATRGGLGQPQPRDLGADDGASNVQLLSALSWDDTFGSSDADGTVPGADPAGWLQRHRWEGLLTPCHVWHAVMCARDAVQRRGAPWAALVVTGFPHAPVTWLPATRDKHARRGTPRRAGDDVYMVLVLPRGRWWLLDMAAAY